MLPLHHPYLVAVRGVEPRIVLDMNQDPDRQDTARFGVREGNRTPVEQICSLPPSHLATRTGEDDEI